MRATTTKAGATEPGPSGASSAWTVFLCGGVRVGRDRASSVAVVGGQAARVLALLAMRHGAVAREELAELLWPGAVLPAHWPNAVRVVLSKIRASLATLDADDEAIVSQEGRASLRLPGGYRTDIERAEALTARAEGVLGSDAAEAAAADSEGSGSAERAVELLAEAEAWLGGDGTDVPRATGLPLVPGLDSRLQDAVSRLDAAKARAQLMLGSPATAIAIARARVAEDPLDETAHRLLIEALLADRRPAAARLAYVELAGTLERELGVAPSDDILTLLAAARAMPTEHSVLQGRLLGRTEELRELVAFRGEVAHDWAPGVAVIEGVSGIGKTRLVREFTLQASTLGVQVLWGACDREGSLPYEPVLRALRRRLTGVSARPADPSPGPALAALLGMGEGSQQAASLTSAASARSLITREIEALVEALVDRPTVWVVDDLQWASADTLAMLSALVASTAAPLLVVAIVRNAPDRVAETVAELLRSAPSIALRLQPLIVRDLEPLIAEISGSGGASAEGTGELAERLHSLTGGHPYFVSEVARQARRSGKLELRRAPASAQAWVRHRLSSLEASERKLLEQASVHGERVSLQELAAGTEIPVEQLMAPVAELIEQGFLVVTDDPDEVRFAHRITRDTVYLQLAPPTRAARHLRIADRLEAAALGEPAALAGHLLRAGPRHAARALEWSVRAAERSLSVGGWALAESQLRRVGGFPSAPEWLAAWEVALGRALHAQHDIAGAAQAFDRALDISRRGTAAPEFSRAVLRMVGRGARGIAGLDDRRRVALLEESLQALREWPVRGDEQDTARVRELLAIQAEGELGWATLFSAPIEERRVHALAGLELLAERGLADPEAEAQALVNARSVRTSGEDFPLRAAETARILDDLPASLLSPEVRFAALYGRHEDELVAGNRAAARRTLALADETARASADPYAMWTVSTWESLGHAIDGDLDVAEARLLEATGRARDLAPEVAACEVVQLICIRLLGGRAREVLPLIGQAADAHPHIPCYRAVEALVASEAGDAATANAALDRCAEDGFEAINHDGNRFLALAVLADVVATERRVDLAAALADLLLPWAGRQVLLNCYGGGGAFWGPCDRLLGRLGALLGDPRADAWFVAAEAAAREIESPWAVARARRDARDARRESSMRRA